MRWLGIAFPMLMEDLCFEAQQAAEKAIKGVLIRSGVEFPYIHDLARLLGLVESARVTVPNIVWRAEVLSPYATSARYPGAVEPVTAEEYGAAIAIAQAVVDWAEEHI